MPRPTESTEGLGLWEPAFQQDSHIILGKAEVFKQLLGLSIISLSPW